MKRLSIKSKIDRWSRKYSISLALRSVRALLPAGLLLLVALSAPQLAAAEERGGAAVAAAVAGPPRPTLLLTFLGDIMAHRPNTAMEDYGSIYRPLAVWLRGDDLTFANLETPVRPDLPQAGYPRFNVHPDYVQAAVDGGVDVFSLANNHSTDWGASGVLATLEALERLRPASDEPTPSVTPGPHSGAARQADGAYLAPGQPRAAWHSGLRASADRRFGVTLVTRAGWRIGFVSVTQFINGNYSGRRLVRLVDWRRDAEREQFLRWVAETAPRYDLFVVSYHGGVEYQLAPTADKARYFGRLIEAGVDIVWGHHPHVLQPWRLVEREDGRRGLIMHSMGNFISGQTWFLGPEDAARPRAFTGDSAALRAVVRWNGAGADIAGIDPLFITHYKPPTGGVVARPLHEAQTAADIPAAWRDYYRRRLQLVVQHVGNTETAATAAHAAAAAAEEVAP